MTLSYSISYLLWFLWFLLGRSLSLTGSGVSVAADIGAKVLAWLGPGLCFLLRKDQQWLIPPSKLFFTKFPWMPTVVGLCLTAIFLHTAHILLSGFGAWGVFQPNWIWLSLSAAVIEEVFFRGLLFNQQAVNLGKKLAAVINGLLFALFHFPEFLLGQNLGALIGLRFWLIAVMGYVFSLIFARWKHLGMNMVIHFVWNLLCFWFALA